MRDDYAAALAAIWERSSYDRGFINNPFAGDDAAKLGLRRTRALLDAMGQPERQLLIVHVAGSKGKGSSCAFVSSILVAAGQRTGRYTSPHLHSYRERIAVDQAPIDESNFAALTQRAMNLAIALEASRPELGGVTAFELTTAMALDHFARAGCTAAVIEVGLGGTLDATNVVDPRVCIITALDFEHTAVLGNTLAGIAANKAGIIKPGRPVVTIAHPPEAMAVIEERARGLWSPLLAEGREWQCVGSWRDFSVTGPWGEIAELHSGLAGNHQMQNAAIAVVAAGQLNALGLPVATAAIRQGIAGTRWPGRYEVVDQPGGTRVVIDGAHTPASAAALAATLRAEESRSPVVLVLGMLGDKNPLAFIEPLAGLLETIVVTASRSPRAQPVAKLAEALAAGGHHVQQEPSMQEAMAAAITLAGPSGLVVATGSLSIVSEAREWLGLATPDAEPSFV